MIMITSEPRIKELLAKGRKERSEAFIGMFKWLSHAARRMADMPAKRRAASKECCPN